MRFPKAAVQEGTGAYRWALFSLLAAIAAMIAVAVAVS